MSNTRAAGAGAVGGVGRRAAPQGYLAHKKHPPLGLYSRTVPRLILWSYGQGLFLMSEESLYMTGAGAVGGVGRRAALHGYLAYKKLPPPRTLQ